MISAGIVLPTHIMLCMASAVLPDMVAVRCVAGANRGRPLSEALRYALHHPAETALRSVNGARAFWGFDYHRTPELRHRRAHPG